MFGTKMEQVNNQVRTSITKAKEVVSGRGPKKTDPGNFLVSWGKFKDQIDEFNIKNQHNPMEDDNVEEFFDLASDDDDDGVLAGGAPVGVTQSIARDINNFNRKQEEKNVKR